MANSENLELEEASDLHSNDVYDEQIEVVEQIIDEEREQEIAGDLQELIFESPLPTYIPVLPPGFEVDSFFECEECGDRFAVESSFQFHKERRSLLIKYDCPHCKMTITTYNRCNLLTHLRIHGNASRNTFDWTRVSVSPLPFEKMLIGPMFNISEYEETIINSAELNDSMKRCTECEIQLRGSLRDHFLGPGKGIPLNHNNKCSNCHMILTSKCSLKAHERYHRQEPPYICPDCAKTFNMWASFCVHLFYCCFHLDKCIRYRCPACKIYLVTAVSLEVHILTLHVKNVFKCNACPIACFSLQTLEEHKVKGHGHTSLPTNAYQQCQLCPDRLIPKARLLFHVIEHVRKPSVCVYGYQCSTCKMFYQKKNEFATHKSYCSEHSSQSIDTTNSLAMLKGNNQNDHPNQSVLNGHSSYIHPSDVTHALNKDLLGMRSAMKTATCQIKNNGNYVPKDSTKGKQISLYDNSRKKNKKNTLENICNPYGSERPTPGNNETRLTVDVGKRPVNLSEIGMCEGCGEEVFTNPKTPKRADIPSLCVSCTEERSALRIRTPRRSSIRPEHSLKPSKNIVSNNSNKTNKGHPPVKRGKNSIALNGPNKKMRLTPSSNKEKDKYKCHICRALIGTEWEVIQNHFAKEHKNFNLLVLSPRINRVDVGNNTSGKSSNSEKKSSVDKKASLSNERKNTNSNTGRRSSTSNVEKKTSPGSEKKTCPNKTVRIKTEPVEEKEAEIEDPQETKGKRTRRKMPPRGVQIANSSQTSQKTSKSDVRFLCFKCKFKSDNVKSFWTHIATHKTDSRAYQCMECGMCFVAKPSFEKHLFISHKIKDVEKYITDHNQCHQKPKRETRSQCEVPTSPRPEDTEELEENQCRVCKTKFETAVQLNKHFRTHGMAFLMLKQQESRSKK